MNADPIRLLEASDLSDEERALLEAGRQGSPVSYDLAAGAARFRASLVVLGAAGVGATAATGARAVTGKSALFGGVATKAILAVVLPAVVVGVAVGAYRFAGSRGDHAAAGAPPLAAVGATKPSGVVASPAALSAPASPAALSAPALPAPPAEERAIEGAPTKEDDPENVERRGPSGGAASLSRAGRVHARSVGGGVPNVHVVLEDDSEGKSASSDGRGGPSGTAEPAAESGGAVENLSTAAPAEHALVEPVAARAPTPSPSVARAPAEVRPAVAPSLPVAQPSAAPSAAPSPPVVARSAADETRAIAHARSLLASNPAEALTALEQVRKDFPAGYFGEERRALTIFALLRIGNRPLAVERAKAFIRSYPNGPFTDKIRSTLGL